MSVYNTSETIYSSLLKSLDLIPSKNLELFSLKLIREVKIAMLRFQLEEFKDLSKKQIIEKLELDIYKHEKNSL